MIEMADGTSLAEALAAVVLEQFEGKDVRRAGVEIPNIAGGLRKAMKIQPRTMRQGDKGWIAFEYEVVKVRFEPIDKENPAGDQERVHILSAEGATFVTEDLVGEQIAEQKAAIKRAEMEAKGEFELPLEDDGSAQAGDNAGDDGKARRGRGRRGLAAVPNGDDTPAPADPDEPDPMYADGEPDGPVDE